MVDGIGSGNEWKNIANTTQNKEYKKVIDKKIDSILGGKKTIQAKDLQKNSVFGKLSDKAQERFNEIAGLDGNSGTFNAEELRVLYTLTDASLKDKSFVFDGKYSTDANSGIEQATNAEMGLVVKNFVKNNAQKRTEALDVKKFDRNKDFVSKVTSDNVDESMLALHDALQTGYVDQRTDKPVSITQAVMLFEDFVEKFRNNGSENFYAAVVKDFTEQTGIPVSKFERSRGFGDGDSFTIGDWKYDCGNLTNNKTGQAVTIDRLDWVNSTDHTIPAADGYIGLVTEYRDGNGTVVSYNYGDEESAAPTGATVSHKGQTVDVKYNPKSAIDPEIYNFIEK